MQSCTKLLLTSTRTQKWEWEMASLEQQSQSSFHIITEVLREINLGRELAQRQKFMSLPSDYISETRLVWGFSLPLYLKYTEE